MLRLEKIFSLEEDVIPSLPPFIPMSQRTSHDVEEEPVPATDSLPDSTAFEDLVQSVAALPPSSAFVNYREPHRRFLGKRAEILKRNVKLIGQEKPDTILYCYDGYIDEVDTEKRTFIDMMDMKTRKRTLLYTHNTVVNIVHASVNQDRNLLVFTIFARFKSLENPSMSAEDCEDIYETCMVEILPQNRVFSLGSPSKKFQRVQFLNCNLQGNAKRQKAVYYLLFILHKEYVHAYSLPMGFIKGLPGACWRIIEQPRKEYSVAKRFLWFQWDLNTQTLYYVYFKPPPKEQAARIEYMLRAVTFGEDGKPEIQLDAPINIRLTRNPAEDSEYLHLPCSRSVPDGNFHMEIVRIDTNSTCICFQSVDEQSRSLIISVIMSHPKTLRREFVVPMNNFSPEVTAATRTYFTSLDGMLVMYIPGHYLQLVDCCSDHDPCPSLFVPELASTLPGIDPVAFPNAYVTNFEIISNDSQAVSSAMYDCQSDTAYVYSFDEDALAKVFEKPSPEAHIQAVHLAICHRQDEGLLKRLTKHLCDENPQFATAEVFKEFLLGSSYQAMKNLKCEPHILKCFPISSIPPFADPVAEDPSKQKLPRQTSFVDEFWRPPNLITKISVPRFNFEIPPSTTAQSVLHSPVTTPTKKSLNGFLGRFFSPTGPEAPSTKAKNSLEDEDESLPQKQKFIDALTEFITAAFPKESRVKTVEWAEKYAVRLASQAGSLWLLIDDARRVSIIAERKENKFGVDPAFLALFQLLEHYFCAIEELSFPFPPKFHTKFSVLGYHCLPRHVFMQYLERGVFQMTDSFMNHIEHILGNSTDPEDAHIKFLMASKMKRKKKALQILRKFKENGALMSENFVANQHLEEESDEDEEDLESQSAPLNVPDEHEESADGEEPIKPNNFLPLVYYTQYLKTRGTKPVDYDFIRRTYSEHFADV